MSENKEYESEILKIPARAFRIVLNTEKTPLNNIKKIIVTGYCFSTLDRYKNKFALDENFEPIYTPNGSYIMYYAKDNLMQYYGIKSDYIAYLDVFGSYADVMSRYKDDRLFFYCREYVLINIAKGAASDNRNAIAYACNWLMYWGVQSMLSRHKKMILTNWDFVIARAFGFGNVQEFKQYTKDYENNVYLSMFNSRKGWRNKARTDLLKLGVMYYSRKGMRGFYIGLNRDMDKDPNEALREFIKTIQDRQGKVRTYKIDHDKREE